MAIFRLADELAMPAPPIEPEQAGARAAKVATAAAGTEHPVETASTDEDVLTALIAQHQAAVRQLVYRLLAWRDGGDDVVQEVFLEAWRRRRRLANIANVEQWLKRVAVNKCRSRQRRDAVRRRWLFWRLRQRNLDIAASPDMAANQDEQTARVRQAIAALGGRYREVVVLHYLERQSIENIATLIGTRRNTVEVRLHRARLQLEKSLADLA